MNVLETYGMIAVSGDVGLEIEVEGGGWEALPRIPNWKLKGDGSLRGQGIEFILEKAIKPERVRSQVDKVVHAVRETKGVRWEPSQRCGVHVHVNVQQMTEAEVFKYVCLYLVFENILLNYCGEHRIGNPFCMSAGAAEDLVYRLLRAAQRGTFRHEIVRQYRYSSVNLASILLHGSLEFRGMRTPPLDDLVNLMDNWANMLIKLRDASAEYEDVRDLVEVLSREGSIPILKRTFQDKADLLRCPTEELLIMSGVRAVQDVVYAGWSIGGGEKLPRPFREADLMDQEGDMMEPQRVQRRIFVDGVEVDERPEAQWEPGEWRLREPREPGEAQAAGRIRQMNFAQPNMDELRQLWNVAAWPAADRDGEEQ